MIMKIFISTDIEGCACVHFKDIWIKNSPEHFEAKRQLTREINASIEGAFAGGATEVVVSDLHSSGIGNFILEELDARAQYIFGESPVSRYPSMADGHYDGIFFLGYHPKDNTPGSSMEGSFVFSINGVEVGELGVDAGVAGQYGVVPLLLTGDDKACQEAAALMPGIILAEVKQSFADFQIMSLSPKASVELIRRKAFEAMQNFGNTKPFDWGSPVLAIKHYRKEVEADLAMLKYKNSRRIDGLKVEFECENTDTLWKHLKAGII